MNVNDIYDHAIDWLWAVVAGAIVVTGRAFVRIWRHEERIKALENVTDHHSLSLQDLSDKVDKSHHETRNHIDSRFEEVRNDLRLIMGRCLSIGDK